MKNRKLLLALILVITFTGGFLAGSFFSANKDSTLPETSKMEQTAPSENKSDQKPKTKIEPKQEIEPEQEKVLLGYVQDFRDPNVVNYSELTHVVFSFAHPTKDGRLLFNGETAMNNLRTMVSKAHQHDTKVMLAVGGWYHIQGGESYEYFKEAISTSSSRTKLINELVNLSEREKLDGVDIDFEHPRTKEDAQHLTTFIKALNKKLKQKDKELSIAVNAKVHSVAGTEINSVVYEPSMFNYVDHVNIMAYDGQWDGSYNAANLSPYSYNENIVNYWTDLFATHHLSKEKLILGIPFYAQPEDPAIKQISYATIIENNPKNAKRDTISMNGTVYHYNGEKTVQKKIKLALQHDFGGIMLWEAGHDAEGTHSLTSVISKTLENADQYALEQNNAE